MPDASLRGRHILVVEDEYMLAMDLERELEEAGAHVVGPVPTVEAALALIDTAMPDGALLDVNLGGQPVFPVADALIERGVPVVFATGYDPRTIPARYAGIPRCDKPVDVRQVTRTLGQLVAAA